MDQRNTPASTGPHSRACGNCARAKAKCISKPGEKCGRCERLQKNCVPVVPVRRAKLAKKSANSTARLEEKLDGLFSLLKSGAQTSAPIGFQPAAHPDHQSADTSLKFQLDTPAESASNDTGATLLTGEGVSLSCHHSLCSAFNIGVNRGDFPSAPGARDGRQTDAEYERAVGDNPPLTFFQPRHSIQSTACHTPADIFSTHPYPTVEEANELLSFFASRMLPAFPFMKMPLYEHSVEFHKEHPFLYLCIIAVASKSTEQQLALGSIIRSTIGQKMLVESERTIDLLQGLLVYSGWSQTHIHTNPIVTNIVQLAIGLLGDLGLKKAPIKQAQSVILNYDTRDQSKPFNIPKRSVDEQRLAVSVFWISSVMSSHFQRIEPLRWTPYLDECLQTLSESDDAPTDKIFVHQIRLQLLTDKALSLTSHDDLGEARKDSIGTAPPAFYRKSLLLQLEAVKKEIPPEFQQTETLLLQSHITTLSINEIALCSTTQTSNAPNLDRAEAFFACLSAAKSWFAVFFRVPPAHWQAFSMASFVQLAHAIITLYRLSIFDVAGWDQSLAGETIDYSETLGEIVKRMKEVKGAAGLDMGRREGDGVDVFSLAAHRFQIIKDWYDAKVVAEAAPQVVSEEPREEVFSDAMDDGWLKDILGMGWEEYQTEYMQTL